MIISYERNFLFVHVPKTGGTSIRHALKRYEHDASRYLVNRCLSTCGIGVNYLSRDYCKNRFRAHESASRVAATLPDDVFARLFKFAFVRNPWDILVSMYKFILKTKAHKRHRLVRKMEFAEFVEYAVSKRICDQSRLLTDDQGILLVDYVGRFESFSSDYARIASTIGVSPDIAHLNRTNSTGFQDFYDRKLRSRVETAYRNDIDLFQYEFESSSISVPLEKIA